MTPARASSAIEILDRSSPRPATTDRPRTSSSAAISTSSLHRLRKTGMRTSWSSTVRPQSRPTGDGLLRLCSAWPKTVRSCSTCSFSRADPSRGGRAMHTPFSGICPGLAATGTSPLCQSGRMDGVARARAARPARQRRAAHRDEAMLGEFSTAPANPAQSLGTSYARR